MMRMQRRGALVALAATLGGWSAAARAFGEDGSFHARLLVLDKSLPEFELTATRRWALELTRRTSAPGRLASATVRPTSLELLQEPFLVWAGSEDPGTLESRAVRALREYLRMGGILLVDDRDPSRGKFSEGARREVARILPESSPVELDSAHVLYKTFYILPGPQGRLLGPESMQAVIAGKQARVLFLQHDLLGALARKGDTWALPMEASHPEARELAVRFAVNLAMYLLCSDYKDDQVHAPFLMRRRHRSR